MPKQKTHKGAKKRFRVTAKGKLRRHQGGKRHLNSHKPGQHKLQLRGPLVTDDKLSKKIVAAISVA